VEEAQEEEEGPVFFLKKDRAKKLAVRKVFTFFVVMSATRSGAKEATSRLPRAQGAPDERGPARA